jgi:hypothetical protein
MIQVWDQMARWACVLKEKADGVFVYESSTTQFDVRQRSITEAYLRDR